MESQLGLGSVFVLGCGGVSLTPRKESAEARVREGWRKADFLTYMAHFGLDGVGINRSKPLAGGGSLLWFSQGS